MDVHNRLDDNPEIAVLEHAIALKEAAKNANEDPLTKLYNRRGMNEVAEHSLGREREFGCILFDLDHFKKINDTHTHSGGDAVLVDTARVIKEQTRGVDIGVRYGGEEFLIILPEIHNIDELEVIAERLRKNFENQKVKHGNVEISRTCSIGISTGVGFLGDAGLENTINQADKALYQAKEAGRNCVRVFKSP